MKRLGIHVRLTNTLTEALQQAIALQREVVQTFVMRTNGTYANPQLEGSALQQLRAQCQQLFVHLSYHVNIANDKLDGMRLLRKELELAQRLEATAVVLHPGAGGKHQTRQQAMNTLRKNLDIALKEYPAITILLENAAHEGRALGGDLEELRAMRTLTNYPERLRFCIDTAHAFVWGYAIDEAFNTQIATLFPADSLALLHLNDATKQRGSYIDQHAVIGQGTIGKEALLNFARSQSLVPIVCENPLLEPQEEYELLQQLAQDLIIQN